MDDEMIKCNLHEVGFQARSQNIEVKGAQLGFPGPKGSSRTKVMQTRFWSAGDVMV